MVLHQDLKRLEAIKSGVEGLGSKVESLNLSQQQALLDLKSEMPKIIEELEELAKARKKER